MALVSALVLVTAAGLAAGAPPASAYDYRDVQVSIQSPAANATVSGTVDVTYVVTAPAGTPVGRVDTTLAGQVREIDLTGRDCSAGCVGSASFDTTTAPLPWNSDPARWTDDGKQSIGVTVDVDGVHVGNGELVTLDNHRPTVTVDGMDAGGLYPLTADDHVTITARPTVHDGGSVKAVYYVSGLTETPMTPPSVPGGPWTFTLDTSRQPNGYAAAAVRVEDDRGIKNIGTRVAWAIDHGFTLTAPAVPDPVLDDDLGAELLDYSYGTAGNPPETQPDTLVTLVDDVEVYRGSIPLWWQSQNPGKVQGYVPVRVPGGHHTLTFVVTDNRGKTGSVTVPVNVTQTLFARFDSGAEAVVLPGEDLLVTATAWSTNSTLWFWQVLEDGVGVYSGGPQDSCTSDCPTSLNPAAKVFTNVPGRHTLDLLVVPRSGSQLVVHSSFTVLPYATGELRGTTATLGRPLTLSGMVTLTGGAPAAAASTVLQRQDYGSSRWDDVASAATDSSGRVQFTVTAGRSDAFRLHVLTDAASWAGTVGPGIVVPSVGSIAMVQAPRRARLGRATAISATVTAPATRGVRLQRYRHGRWVTLRPVAYPSSTGHVRLRYVPRTVGRQRLRVLRPAADGLAATYGHSWTLRVHR